MCQNDIFYERVDENALTAWIGYGKEYWSCEDSC